MSLMKTLQFYFSALGLAIRASISQRGAFLIEAFFMLANNLIFLMIWWVFFHQFKDIAGWTMRDLIALNAIGMGGYGLALVCFGGARFIGKIIISGDLDPFMTQPKNILVNLLASKSLPKGWGNILTTIILIFIGGFTSPFSILVIAVGMVCGCLMFTSIAIIAQSTAFWLGPIDTVAKKYCDCLFLFSVYPSNIYSGMLQVVMFTLLPAGIIGFLPVELLRDFTWTKLIVLLSSAITFFILAFVVFFRGLKRYESGNQFGMRL